MGYATVIKFIDWTEAFTLPQQNMQLNGVVLAIFHVVGMK